MFNEMSKYADTPLINFIAQRLEQLGWSPGKMAGVAGIQRSTISYIMRGRTMPDVDTVMKMADALSVERDAMMRAYSKTRTPDLPPPDLHSTALYMAKQLTNLPETLREAAIDAVSGVVDSFATVAKSLPNNTGKEQPIYTTDSDLTLEEWREAKRVAPETYYGFLEERLGPNWREIVEGVAEMLAAPDKQDDGGQEILGLYKDAE